MKHILLLHGALGSAEQFDELETQLSSRFIVHTLNFSGHGGLPIPEEGFSIELFAKDVLNFLDEKKISSINIFGFSMGGYVALHLAVHHPSRIKKIFTLATKLDWSREAADREIKMLNPEKMQVKIPDFVKSLDERHSPSDWKKVVQQTAGMMQRLSEKPLAENDFKKIEIPVRLTVGDRDQMVSLNETQQTFKALKSASLLVLPETPHTFEKVNVERLGFELKMFFNHAG